MFLVPIVSADFGNGHCSKLVNCLVFALFKCMVFVPIFGRR